MQCRYVLLWDISLEEGMYSLQESKVTFPVHFTHSLLIFTVADMRLCSEYWRMQMFFMLKMC